MRLRPFSQNFASQWILVQQLLSGPAMAGARIPKSLHRQLKLHCVTHDTSVMDFVTEAIEEKLGRKTRPKGSER